MGTSFHLFFPLFQSKSMLPPPLPPADIVLCFFIRSSGRFNVLFLSSVCRGQTESEWRTSLPAPAKAGARPGPSQPCARGYKMLKNVILISASGLVLFSKEFMDAVAQPRLIGSLLTAMIEFSKRATGMAVSYIELEHIAATIVTNEKAHVFCAIFHGADDGPDFGQLIATQILSAFVNMYSKQLGNVGGNLKDFEDFQYNIKEAIKSSTQSVLMGLEERPGIDMAILASRKERQEAFHTTDKTRGLDQIGFRANLQALMSVSDNFMSLMDDTCEQIWIEPDSTGTRILVQRIPGEKSTLVIKCQKTVHQPILKQYIDDAIHVILKISILTSSMAEASV